MLANRQTDTQTYSQTDDNTPLPYGRSNKECEEIVDMAGIRTKHYTRSFKQFVDQGYDDVRYGYHT